MNAQKAAEHWYQKTQANTHAMRAAALDLRGAKPMNSYTGEIVHPDPHAGPQWVSKGPKGGSQADWLRPKNVCRK